MQPSNSDIQKSVTPTEGPTETESQLTNFHGSSYKLDQRYEIQELLGSGSYGDVIQALDKQTGQPVAIKKMTKAFENSIYARRALRELRIMRLLDHENIIRIQTVQLPIQNDEFEELYVVMELMDTDLGALIKSPQDLSDQHCQYFIYSILRGLKFMHSAGILHRDLKPRNVLINSACDTKICDFGLARAIHEKQEGIPEMTDYVATRWYRAPEILLGQKQYSAAMDIWSVGCILGELLLRRPLLPGKNTNNQMELIFKLLGKPSSEDLMAVSSPLIRKMLNQFPGKQSNRLGEEFRGCNPEAVNLMQRMLEFNPAKRISIEQAMQHPYLIDLHDPEDEPEAMPVSHFDFYFEGRDLDIPALRQMIYDEILLYHSEGARARYAREKTEFENSLIKASFD